MVMLTAGVIFGGRGIVKRWIHKRRMKRNDKFKRRAKEIYKRHFRHELTEIERWRHETEPKHERYEKYYISI